MAIRYENKSTTPNYVPPIMNSCESVSVSVSAFEVYGKKRKLMECTYARLFAIEIGQQQERPKQQQQQAECVNNILIGFEIGIKPWIRECVIKSRFTHSIICFCFGEKEKNNKQN